MGGMTTWSTRLVTILPKAPPMITPTARSTTLPRAMKARNSVARDMSGFPAAAGRETCAVSLAVGEALGQGWVQGAVRGGPRADRGGQRTAPAASVRREESARRAEATDARTLDLHPRRRSWTGGERAPNHLCVSTGTSA